MELRDQIISLMYESAVSPELWPATLKAFAVHLQAVGGILFVYHKQSMTFSGFMGGDALAPDSMPPYVEYYHRIDPLILSTSTDPESNRVTLCQEHVPPETVAKSEFYQDFLITKRGRYRSGWHLENSSERQISLALFNDARRFERSQFSEWEPVIPHARQAARLMEKISPLRARGELLREAIEHKRMNCIMVDSNARVLDCSSAAATLLESGKVLKLRNQSQLTAVSTEETMRLFSLITSAATGRKGGMMRLAERWLLHVVPSGIAQENLFDRRFAHCALVFVTAPEPSIPIDWRRIQLALECTRAEAEVAADLGSGISPSEIAAKRNVSLSTVRTQIRILLERTGSHRIDELVSRLAGIC